MNKLTVAAFHKLQKREHLLRAARERFGLGRVTREVFREAESAIIKQYELTDEEQRAYELYSKVQGQRKRK